MTVRAELPPLDIPGARKRREEEQREQDARQTKPNGEAQPLPPLKPVTASELLSLRLPPRESVLGPWLSTKTLAMIFGPRGEGKTFIGLGLAIAIATGGKFLCWQAPKPRRVLYLDGEMPAEVMQERLGHLLDGKAADNLDIITPDLQLRPMPNLAAEEGQAEVAEWVDRADVVLVDNLACLCRSGDENERQPWLVMQGWMLGLRTRGKTVIMQHHAGKGGDQRGTSAREDVLDVVVKLRQPSDYQPNEGLRAEWHFTKHRGFHGEDARPLEVKLLATEREGLTWSWCQLESSLVRQVAEWLNETTMSLRDIAVDMGISKSYVHKLKNQAKAMGLLKKKGVDG
jgi:putative DNA primase/helicase